MMIG
jgi:hypothetical protein